VVESVVATCIRLLGVSASLDVVELQRHSRTLNTVSLLQFCLKTVRRRRRGDPKYILSTDPVTWLKLCLHNPK
jgi:hypothetical protein